MKYVSCPHKVCKKSADAVTIYKIVYIENDFLERGVYCLCSLVVWLQLIVMKYSKDPQREWLYFSCDTE
jgi:hypothetical protein